MSSQAMLRYMSLTDEQRASAAVAMASAQQSSALSIRLGKIGG